MNGNMSVLNRTAVGLLLISVLWAAGCGTGSREEDSAAASRNRSPDSVSLRNQSDRLVHVTVTWEGNRDYPLDLTLRSGEIEQLPFENHVVITFRSLGEVLRRPLIAGRIYSFRMSENGRLMLETDWPGGEHPENLAPFLATPMEVVDGMLDLAGVTAEDLICDLGSGDGRIPIRAALRFGAHGLGIEYNPGLVEESRAAARSAGVADRVEFTLGDVLKADFSQATVVTIYLLSSSNRKLRPQLERQLKRGTRVVTHDFPIPGWERRLVRKQTLERDGRTHTLFLYRR
jgi:SAM-dependent methyltransferase